LEPRPEIEPDGQLTGQPAALIPQGRIRKLPCRFNELLRKPTILSDIHVHDDVKAGEFYPMSRCRNVGAPACGVT